MGETFIHKGEHMRKNYDFSGAKKNSYAAALKKQITIRLDEESISYFKGISEQVGIPYQSLINLYLRDCATSNRKLSLKWAWLFELFKCALEWLNICKALVDRSKADVCNFIQTLEFSHHKFAHAITGNFFFAGSQ